jgi:hypothetical protein
MPPQKTDLYDMPNACAVSCHMNSSYPNFGIDFTNDDLGDWSEATDQALADSLMYYYGPSGIWWVHDVTSISGSFANLPVEYKLSQNYPNPFNPSTTIPYTLPKSMHVRLTVYNVIGQEVAVLVNGVMKAGNHRVVFTAGNIATGLYLYRLETDGFVITKKMLVMK